MTFTISFNIGCPLKIHLPTLRQEVKCHIPSYCTGIECCVDIDILNRGIRFTLQIDSCANRLVVGIEKLQYNISLIDYEWGKIYLFMPFWSPREYLLTTEMLKCCLGNSVTQVILYYGFAPMIQFYSAVRAWLDFIQNFLPLFQPKRYYRYKSTNSRFCYTSKNITTRII